MGLDQYAYRLAKQPEKPADFSLENRIDQTEPFFYWRKHANLQGWMETLYYLKGGHSDVFNGTPVLVEAEDLDRLERNVKNKELPKTEGFFFGQSGPEDDEDTLEFIAKARAAIREGSYVAYDSWW